jgi:serine/threonine protein kinase
MSAGAGAARSAGTSAGTGAAGAAGAARSAGSAGSACNLEYYAWAPLFGLPSKSRVKDVCEAVSKTLPPVFRKSIRLRKVINRGGYGIVFMGQHKRTHEKVAVKIQFVCPKKVKDWRTKCAAFGQRAVLYDVVKYEYRIQKMVHSAMEAARRVPGNELRLIPIIPKPISGSKVLLGKKGQYPTIPPDGRRRLWVSVSEYVNGRSLREVIYDAYDDHTLTGDLFESLCKSILMFLFQFHKLGFTHGDTHSGNIMLDYDRANRGEPWLYLIDLERCIPLDYFDMEATTAGPSLIPDMLKLWDLKLFCESAAGLAESASIGGGSEPTPWDNTSNPPTSPAMEQYLRCKALMLRLIGYYMKRDVSGEAWARDIVKVWTIRTLYLKRSVSMKTVPNSIQADVSEIDVERQDAMQKNNFFIVLRKVQKFYTATR